MAESVVIRDETSIVVEEVDPGESALGLRLTFVDQTHR
jgi:hypothetical protein